MVPLPARHANRLPDDAVFETDHSELNVDVAAFQQQNCRRSDTQDNFALRNFDRRECWAGCGFEAVPSF